MTGLPMDTTNDGKIEGNEWEHIAISDHIWRRIEQWDTFDLGQDARQNSEQMVLT